MTQRADKEVNDRARRDIESGKLFDDVAKYLTEAYGNKEAASLVIQAALRYRPEDEAARESAIDIAHSDAMHRVMWADESMALERAVEHAHKWMRYFGEPPELVAELQHEIEIAEGRVAYYEDSGGPSIEPYWTS